MTKLMYALWGSGLERTLHAPAWHERLSAAGATTLQVNICDEDVSSAQLRMSTYPEPIAAIVGAWTAGEAGPITEALSEVADHLDGWIVDERIPLPAPPAGDGACPTT